MDFDWLIIGGGLHGVHIAARLVADGGVKAGRLGIVDPEAGLLHRWKARTDVVGMKYLRSPVMHHIDTEPYSLFEFGANRPEPIVGDFTAPNDRPALSLFNDHCRYVIERLGLEQSHLQDRVVEVDARPDGVVLRLASSSTIRSARVVLAIGEDENVAWPEAVPREDPRVSHVFDRHLHPQRWRPQSVCVLGGGASAVQFSLHLARLGHQVNLVTRHSMRVHQYDAEPGWFGPKFMDGFERLTSLETRRSAIAKARHRGSVTPDTHASLRQAVRRGDVAMHVAGLKRVETVEPQLRVVLSTGDELRADRLVSATGIRVQSPGSQWLRRLAAARSLPTSPCGFPVLDSTLRWHSRVHVSGALAELELGPVAKNIAGARRAGERILRAL